MPFPSFPLNRKDLKKVANELDTFKNSKQGQLLQRYDYISRAILITHWQID